MNLKELKNTIPASGKEVVLYQNGITENIIKSVVEVAGECSGQVQKFAFKLKGKNRLETANKVWQFIRSNILYIEDPAGVQRIKEPNATLREGYGDCKSYSILASCILQALNIENIIRFVVPEKYSDYRHTYPVVVLENGKHYPIDPCLRSPGIEQPYSRKTDYNMTRISRVSGLSVQSFEIDPYMNAGTLQLLIARERMQLEKLIASRLSGIGSPVSNKLQAYSDNIELLNEALRQVKSPEKIVQLGSQISGVGIAGIGDFFKKVGNAIKDGVKAVTKVVSAPARLAIKGVLEVGLPKAAMSFLYLYIPPDKVSKLPDVVQRKYNKQLKIRNFICDKIGMNGSTFDGLVRNGIMKESGKTPEMLLSELFGSAISGIGFPVALVGTAVRFIIDLINKIKSIFGASEESFDETDAPSETDAAGLATPVSFSDNISHNTADNTGVVPSQNLPAATPKDNTMGANNTLLIGAAALAALLLSKAL